MVLLQVQCATYLGALGTSGTYIPVYWAVLQAALHPVRPCKRHGLDGNPPCLATHSGPTAVGTSCRFFYWPKICHAPFQSSNIVPVLLHIPQSHPHSQLSHAHSFPLPTDDLFLPTRRSLLAFAICLTVWSSPIPASILTINALFFRRCVTCEEG